MISVACRSGWQLLLLFKKVQHRKTRKPVITMYNFDVLE